MTDIIPNMGTQKNRFLDLEIQYLKQTINVLREKLEKSKITEEENIQSVKKVYFSENIQLKNTVNLIEQLSSIELLAIGIGHDVKRYYKKAIKITDVQDLGDVMINELTDLFSEKKTVH